MREREVIERERKEEGINFKNLYLELLLDIRDLLNDLVTKMGNQGW